MYYLYILKSLKDNKLYVGISNNIKRRLKEHNAGKVRSTRNRKPFIIIYTKLYPTKKDAAKQEWLLKHTPGAGKKKWSLIKGN